MTTVDPNFAGAADREARKARLFTRINKADKWFQVLGLAWLTPILKAAAGDNPRAQAKDIWRLLGVPLLAIAAHVSAVPLRTRKPTLCRYSAATSHFALHPIWYATGPLIPLW